ncbi:glycosyltransferase family 2 protein [Muricauda sp. SCSIO 64092]|uniref:glycosyltransferase family 2 protein n=1 Tax=Allomuricauda sp. SCSIO 64092 TaxID=2908842 RepID=UPI001FF45C5E|nr:glycosyltransferase family 2 protein [Muricauda sp. SCSIO 64092]UOY08834.1 glycosyltransferase family 2 protein [Muricauda sp. SCSIO 64092]
MGLAILIPVYNQIFYTKQCIKNLKKALVHYHTIIDTRMNSEIIVIDDGSTDGTSEWLAENHHDVTVLKGDGNLFWSAAINMGIEHMLKASEHSHILFWNKDLYIESDYFVTLHRILQTTNDRTILTSKMYRKNTPDLIFSFGGTYNPKTDKKVNIGTGKKDGPKFEKITKVDWCGGMAVIMPVAMFGEIGLCDAKSFPQYDGDTDLFLRAKDAGYDLHVYPDLKAWNLHENTGKKDVYSFKNYLWYLNDIRSFKNLRISFRFLKKHSIGFFPYFFFVVRYVKFSLKYFTKTLLSYTK